MSLSVRLGVFVDGSSSQASPVRDEYLRQASLVRPVACEWDRTTECDDHMRVWG